MVIFWGGSKGKEYIGGSGEFYCPNCKRQCRFVYKKQVKQYSAYFIPLHEKDLGSYVECQSCGQAFNPEVLELQPPSTREAEVFFHKARTAFDLGHHQEAIGYYDQSLQLEPANPTTWFNKGTVLILLQRYEEAVRCFDRAYQMDSDYIDALHNKGTCLNGLGRYEEAITCFNKVLEQDFRHIAALVSRGVSLGYLGSYDEAVSQFDEALEIDPGNSEALRLKGIVEEERRKHPRSKPISRKDKKPVKATDAGVQKAKPRGKSFKVKVECPYCGQKIWPESRKCDFCKKSLVDADADRGEEAVERGSTSAFVRILRVPWDSPLILTVLLMLVITGQAGIAGFPMLIGLIILVAVVYRKTSDMHREEKLIVRRILLFALFSIVIVIATISAAV